MSIVASIENAVAIRIIKNKSKALFKLSSSFGVDW